MTTVVVDTRTEWQKLVGAQVKTVKESRSMAHLGIRITQPDGSPLRKRNTVLRARRSLPALYQEQSVVKTERSPKPVRSSLPTIVVPTARKSTLLKRFKKSPS